MIEVTKAWSGESVKILELVWQDIWSKVHRKAKLSGVFIETMELHEEVKKNPKTEYPCLLVDVFRISRMRFILRGVEL